MADTSRQTPASRSRGFSFAEALGRLKEQLGMTTDREVAAALGLAEKAFNARKARGSFPEDKVFALASRRPELRLDPRYVLTGMTRAEESGVRNPAHEVGSCAQHLLTVIEKAAGNVAPETHRATCLQILARAEKLVLLQILDAIAAKAAQGVIQRSAQGASNEE